MPAIDINLILIIVIIIGIIKGIDCLKIDFQNFIMSNLIDL